MTPRSDATAAFSAGFLLGGDSDVLAINGHHFELGATGATGVSDPA